MKFQNYHKIKYTLIRKNKIKLSISNKEKNSMLKVNLPFCWMLYNISLLVFSSRNIIIILKGRKNRFSSISSQKFKWRQIIYMNYV